MLVTRTATVADAGIISSHRRAMFAAMGGTQDSILDAMERNCEPWLERMIPAGKYLGWITCDDALPVASAGLLVLDWPPHPFDPAGELRGYLLNVFVEPEFRRRKLAHALVELCMAEARRRGIRVVTLHASEAGRPLYQHLGFHTTNEMMFVNPVEG